jgi:hypothetical protein
MVVALVLAGKRFVSHLEHPALVEMIIRQLELLMEEREQKLVAMVAQQFLISVIVPYPLPQAVLQAELFKEIEQLKIILLPIQTITMVFTTHYMEIGTIVKKEIFQIVGAQKNVNLLHVNLNTVLLMSVLEQFLLLKPVKIFVMILMTVTATVFNVIYHYVI